jgi:hypothetical protein
MKEHLTHAFRFFRRKDIPSPKVTESQLDSHEPVQERFLFKKPLPKPTTFDDSTRSVWVVATTETPYVRFDPWLRTFIPLVHLVDGIILPPSGQVPLLDTHDPTSIMNVLGSARNFRKSGNAIECQVFFSGTAAGKEAARKVKEGHLTDFSVGYLWTPQHSTVVPQGKTERIHDKTYEGPIRIIQKWWLKELSICPIGQDINAKARGEAMPLTEVKEEELSVSSDAPAADESNPLLTKLFDITLLGFILLMVFMMIRKCSG